MITHIGRDLLLHSSKLDTSLLFIIDSKALQMDRICGDQY